MQYTGAIVTDYVNNIIGDLVLIYLLAVGNLLSVYFHSCQEGFLFYFILYILYLMFLYSLLLYSLLSPIFCWCFILFLKVREGLALRVKDEQHNSIALYLYFCTCKSIICKSSCYNFYEDPH